MFGTIVVLALMDRGTGYFFSLATAFSVFQQFATLGFVALGLGLSMLVREFDLSVAGMVGLAGCIAVLTGVHDPWLGCALGIAAGAVSGLVQGLIMTRLASSSVAVTLGGLLTLQGITYVLTGNRTIDYPNMPISLALSNARSATCCRCAARPLSGCSYSPRSSWLSPVSVATSPRPEATGAPA